MSNPRSHAKDSRRRMDCRAAWGDVERRCGANGARVAGGLVSGG